MSSLFQYLSRSARTAFIELVYVIGQHAVQFGNKWMKKILGIAKIG